jgi:probable O-glycosylation ligase (exosortase A-associated)
VRDILVLIIVAATIPAAFFRPFYGLLGFSWLAYMRPQDLSWGLAATLPLSKFVALAVWASLIMRGKINIVRNTLVTWVMLALWGWLLVATLTAEHPNIATDKLYEISKVFLISLLTLVIVSSRERFMISVAVIAFSLGLLGLKFGLFGLLQGGVRFTRGVGGMIGDNNDFALAMCMNLPLLVYVATLLPKLWARWAAIALVPLTAVTVVFTHSRGGFLSLAAVTAVMIFTSRRRVPALLVTAGLVAVGSLTVPESYYERILSIADYQNDASAMGRLNAWRAAVSMANDYPFTGVGLDNFMSLFPFYAPDPENIKVAHNTYLQMLAETGYIGLSIYLTLMVATFWTLETTRRKAKRLRLRWAQNGAKYLAATLIAFMVGATFLNRAHFDLTYHVMFLAACMKRIVGWEAKAMLAAARAAAPAETGTAAPPTNRQAELVVR